MNGAELVDGVYRITVPMIYDPVIAWGLFAVALVGAIRIAGRVFPVIGI